MYTHLNYIPRGPKAKASARHFLGYIGERPGKDEEKANRLLFGNIGTYTKEQAEELLQTASQNTYFWRLILSPDPNTEDKDKTLDLWDLTREAVSFLEKKLERNGLPRDIPFIGAEHEHTDIRHIHAVLLIKRFGREKLITPEILAEFKTFIEQKAATQGRAQEQAIGKEELIQQVEQGTGKAYALLPSSRSAAPVTGSADIAGLAATPCPHCFLGVMVRRINSKVIECDRGGYALKQGRVIRQSRAQTKQWTL
jgi:hypothetical protein